MNHQGLYITADTIGAPTGGGSVTFHEASAFSQAVRSMTFGRNDFPQDVSDPWGYDEIASKVVDPAGFKLAHFYAGTFSDTVDKLKSNGAKITYTAAAHDINASRKEHELLGIPYNYPHLTESKLWERYVRGYLQSDVLICPSNHSAEVMRSYGAKQRIEIIPHGINLPANVSELPSNFVVGYLGAIGPDKGLIYLLQAWKQLDLKDSVLLIGGRFSTSPYMIELVRKYGGGNIHLCGWVNDVSAFYNSIVCYVQPSVTEGFGIEVLEAMAHKRMVICSDGAGACDLLPISDTFHACDVESLMNQLANAKASFEVHRNTVIRPVCEWNYEKAKLHTWEKIRQKYVDLWRSLL